MIEDIRLIGNNLGFTERFVITDSDTGQGITVLDRYGKFCRSSNFSNGGFNPYENDADAFKVLEALLELSGQLTITSGFNGTLFCVEIVRKYHEADDFRSAICAAYLSLINQPAKEG